jgi:replicative DNA helicase
VGSLTALLDPLEAAAAEGLAPNLRRFLSFLGWKEGEVFELQALHVPADKSAGRWKDSPGMAAHGATLAAIERLAAQGDSLKAQGVYAIFNRIDPGVQYRRGPDAWHEVPKGEGTSDRDITHRRALYIDLDPQRTRGISASGGELLAAAKRAEQAREILLRTIPAEAIGFGRSGNGCALFVALEPMSPEGEPARLVKAALVALAGLLDDEAVKVDTSVSDAKRLCFLPGTTKRKGAHHPDRPHRRASFLGPEVPRRLALAELRALVMALREQLPEDRRAEVDKELAGPPSKGASRSKPAPGPRGAPQRGEPGEGACEVANRNLPVQEVLARLGLLEEDRPICPGCRESDKGVAIVGNGLKCSHNRCSNKGHSKGFRTVVDLVMEAEGIEAREALAWIRREFPGTLPELPPRQAAPPPEPDQEQAPLLPLTTPKDLPPFPVHALPPQVASLVEQLTDSLECPADLPACLALGAIASVAMKRYEVCPRGDWIEPLNLYLAVAMEPGESKSPVFRRIFGPLYKLQKKLLEVWERECERIDKDNAERDKGEPEEEKPPRPRLFVDDATPEKIGMVLAEQGERITLASDEGTAFQHMCGLYSKNGQANGGVYLKAHDGGSYVVDRATRDSIHLEAPLMTVALAVQPTVIRELALRPDLRGRGLWARFAYSFPASRVGTRTHDGPPVDPQVAQQWEELLLGITRGTMPLPESPAVIHFSSEARRRFHRAEVAIERAMAPGEAMASVRDWAGKLRGLIARLAGLLHLAEEAAPELTTIGPETIERALALARYFAAHARYTFDIEMTLDPAEQAARQAWEAIQRKGWTRVTPRDVSRAVNALRRIQDAAAALEVLRRHGCLVPARAHHGKAYEVRAVTPPEG